MGNYGTGDNLSRDLGDLTGAWTPWDDPGYRSYLNNFGVSDYYGTGSVPEGAMSYQQWKALNGSTNTTENTQNNTTPSNSYVVLPPGVDPYYGITISGLNDYTGGGGGSTLPNDTSGLGGSTKSTDYSGQSDQGYKDYLISAGGLGAGNGVIAPDGAMSYQEWKYWKDNTGSSNNNTSGINTGSGGFKIARPNMTWVNSLPSVIPPGGQALADMYGPTPFTREANTPGVTYTKPPLTYNNPYNTNPYLPLSNPFALIANNTGNTNG